MRLFVAIEIPEPVRREVRRRTAGLRERLPRARWVDPDLLHLNLLFLGEVAGDAVAALVEGLRGACAGGAPFPLRLAGAGGFPPQRPARVVWAGGEAPPELGRLQSAIAAGAAATVGLAVDERPYRPHVTLARCPSPWSRATVDKVAAAFAGEVGPPFVVREATLVLSKLSPRGPRHEALASLPLEAAAEASVAGGQQ